MSPCAHVPLQMDDLPASVIAPPPAVGARKAKNPRWTKIVCLCPKERCAFSPSHVPSTSLNCGHVA